MKISRREKILILAMVAALIIFVGYKYVITPNQAELSKVKVTNSQLNQQVQKAVQEGKLNISYQSAISKQLANYLKLEEQLPRDKKLVELVDQLGNMADENDVTLLSVAYTEAATGQAAAQINPNASNMSFTLSVSGSYYHLLSYLQALDNSTRIILVQSASMSVGQYKTVATISSVDTNNISTSNASKSVNLPPAVPISKGTRLQTAAANGTVAVSAPVQTGPVVPEMDKYDLGNIQLNLQITSYYDQSGSEIDKLLSSKQIKLLTGGTASNAATDANTKLVVDAVKKSWDKENPGADWSNSRNPDGNCWNGKVLKYLEGKYNNTNMGKNVRGLVNPLAKTINPDSQWAGTAIFNWDRVLDMKMSSKVNPVDPDTKKTYANVLTREFFPVAVYITYLPNYAPEKVSGLSASQKQAVMGSIIVWQAKDSINPPVVYRIDENGQVQDISKIK